MIQEALEFFFDKARDAAQYSEAKKFDLPGDGRTVTVEHNGELLDFDVPPPLRSHQVDSVTDLVAAAKKWAKDNASIWVGESKLVLVIDDEDRRECVTCPLIPSTVFARARSLAVDPSSARMDQAALMRLLRREFREARGASEMLTAVRRIKFKRHVDGHSDITHGGESLGQAIENEITGAGDIPETLVVETNVFSNHGERDQIYKIGMDLEVEAAAQRFILRPLPDEIEAAAYAALCDIEQRIKTELPKIAVFFGRP